MTDEDIERTYCASPEGASRVHVVEYVDRDVKGEIAGDCAFLPALGAALAASEVQW